MKLRPITAAVAILLAASAAHADDLRRSYIVQLVDKPVATYNGTVSGLPATQPAPGQRLDVDASTVQDYINYLDNKKAAVLGSVGAAQITHEYKVVFNGFAALLTDDEVRALKKNSGVANITADSILQLDTNYTPRFLGLDVQGGLWDKAGGQAHAGEDIIIGIVDGGVWPENPAYADRVDGDGNPSHSGATLVYDAPPARWKGTCQTGEGFSVANCNNKLIGARYYNTGNMALHWSEFASPRDSVGGTSGRGGHGSHTSSTAGGNAGNPAMIGGVNIGKLSGMAPRARIAAYKVCWTNTNNQNGCPTSDSVAAIEQATLDGVNVINFSIGPNAGGGSFSEATEMAFLGAASAGVFVAASAGNSGPTAASPAPVSHISPWLTTVANSTHNRMYQGSATLGNGTVLYGASSNAKTPSAPLILARDAGLAGVDPSDIKLNQCFGPADNVSALLDPAKVEGKILVCDRGVNALINKSANAKTAKAVGVIIGNVSGGATTLLNVPHTLSAVQLKLADATTLKSYMKANSGASAALGDVRAVVDPSVTAPIVNGSSSRGPNVANANILKPDLAAPGTDILAAVSADLTQAERDAVAGGAPAPRTDYDFYTGTSMASPHVAGVAAVLKQNHPDWSPAAIKSALMTTTYDTYNDGQNGSVSWDATAKTTGTLPWGQGAGQIRPSLANDPGLVYDITPTDYTRFLCGVKANVYSAATCNAVGSIAPYNLNLASLTAAAVPGAQTLVRTVTNVGASTATYTASATMNGYSVEVSPATLTLAPGDKASFSVRLTRTTAPLDTWAYGQLTWSDGAHTVRSPITARGTALAVQSAVYSEATTGSKLLTMGSGVAGAVTLAKGGLVPATVSAGTVTTYKVSNPSQACNSGGAPGVNYSTVEVPAGALAARFTLREADTGGREQSDLDLVVLRGSTVVGGGYSSSANEEVFIQNPVAGTYKVCVLGYAPVNGSDTYKLNTWVITNGASGGNFKVGAPSTVSVGGTGTVGLAWSGLAAGQRYLGFINYLVGGTVRGTTLLEVDATDPVPAFSNSRSKSLPVE